MLRLDPSEQERLAREFLPHADRGRALKFVAASGAASRMFNSHLAYAHRVGIHRRELMEQKLQGDVEAEELLRFFDNLSRFPFFESLQAVLASRGHALEEFLGKGSYGEILDALLGPDGLGYASAPKGLIPFHRYLGGARTAFEEHLLEAAGYLRDQEGVVKVHFTVPAGEETRVKQHLYGAAARFKEERTEYEVSVSPQHRATDTIALDCDNSPVRDDEGRLLLWPAGHGTLLQNLNDLRGDVVFVRTIDNILPDRLKGAVAFFKRVMGGLLVTLQQKVFQAVETLESCSFDRQTSGALRSGQESR